MSSVDYLLEHYRKELGITEEQEQQMIEDLKKGSPLTQLDSKLSGELTNLDERTVGMQDIDFFTLDQTSRLDERTTGMQDIDQFTLDLAFELLARIEVLEQEIQTLKGGN